MLAPKITPAAWYRFISPEFTKLTTMAVQAEEDWIIPVKTIPTNMPVKRLVVKNSRIRRSLAPATFSMESLIRSMPNRKSPRPPAKDKKIRTFMRLFPSFVSTSYTQILLF